MEYENKARDAENRGDYLSAIKYYFQALETIKDMQLIEGLQFDSGNILHRIGNLYSEIGNYDAAIKFFIESTTFFLESDEPLTKVYRLVAESHSNIGACYLTESKFQTALEYFKKAFEQSKKATELEEELLKRYVVERSLFNLALIILCLINLDRKTKEILPLLEKAVELNRHYNVSGLAPSLILFFRHILTERFSEARIILKNEIEETSGASLLPSTLEASVIGLVMELAAKHIPEARIQIKGQVIEEKGEVILSKKIFEDMLLHGLSFANKQRPRSQYKEVYSLVIGKVKKDDVIVSEIVPITSGSDVEVEFKNEHYTKAAIIDSIAAERGEFIVGWFHTHPELGLFLSPTDIINQLGYQILNDKAIAVVFDFTQMTPGKPGFVILRLDDPSMGAASSFHSVHWRIKDASKDIFNESMMFFDKFLIRLNTLILEERQLSLDQLVEKLDRSEPLLEEIIPQWVALRYLPNTTFDPKTKILSLKS